MTLIRNRGEFLKWKKEQMIYQGGSPEHYPCFVQELFDADEDTYPEFWYEPQLRLLADELAAAKMPKVPA